VRGRITNVKNIQITLIKGKLNLHGERRLKNKPKVSETFRFNYFHSQIGGNSVSNEDNIDYLHYLYDNTGCLQFRYLYRDAVRWTRTLG
jgi:hypothetical protein